MSRRPVSVTVAVLVVLSVLAGPAAVAPASAGTLSDLTVSPAPNDPATSATWTVNATADSDLGGQSLTEIRVNTDANSDADFSNVSAGDVVRTTVAGEPYEGSVDGVSTENNGRTLVITYDGSGQGIQTGDRIEVAFENGVTPSSPGTYQFRVGVDDTSSGVDEFTVEGPVTNRDTGEQFATIGGAFAAADTAAGHTIAVEGGTYDERVTVNESVRLVATGDATVTGTGGTAFDVTADGATVDGFTVRGGDTGVAVRAGRVDLTDLTVVDTGTAVRVAGDDATLTDGVLRSNDRGVVAESGAGPSTVRRTEFLDNAAGVVGNGDTVDARYNWWGAPSGPSGDGPGTGDSVEGNVIYDPWLQPDVAVSPRTYDFGTVTVGATNETTVAVRNEGNRTLTVDGVSLVGPNASQYAVVDGASGTLDPGEREVATVAFEPEAAGPLDADLAIRSDDPDTPQATVALTGTGEPRGNESTGNESTGNGTDTNETDTGNESGESRPQVVVERTDGTGPTRSVAVRVRDAGALQTVRANTSVGSAASNLTVDRVSVVPNRSGNFSLNVTVSPDRLSTTPEFTPESVDAVGYVNVSHDIRDENISRVVFRHRVPRRTLNETGVPPDEVALYRYDDGSWTALNTTLVNETDDAYVYRSVSPGLSEFGEGVQYPDIRIAEATVSVRSVSIDEEIEVPVRVTNGGPADGAYTVRLLVNDSSVATRDITVPANGTRQVTFQRAFDRSAEYVVEVNNVSAGTVVVYDPQQGTPTSTPTPMPSATPPPTATGTPTATTAPGGTGTADSPTSTPGGLLAGVGVLPVAGLVGGATVLVVVVLVGRAFGPG